MASLTPALTRCAAAVCALAIGCGGGGGDGDERPDGLTSEQTARAWVDAVNARDYGRACELSVHDDKAECFRLLRRARPGRGLRVDAFDDSGAGEASFDVSSRAERRVRGSGWTAYAPRYGFAVVRQDGGHRVRFDSGSLGARR